MTKMKIPEGWRKLRVGETIKPLDKYFCLIDLDWFLCAESIGHQQKENWLIRIRKLSKKKKSKMTMADLAGEIYGLKNKK